MQKILKAAGRAACLALTALGINQIAGPAPAQGLFSPAVKVNGSVISRYELDQRAQFLRLLGAPADPDKLAREQLIDDHLKRQAAEDLGISVAPEDVRAGMEEFAKRANLPVDQFVAELQRAGVSEQTFRDFVEVGQAWRDVVRARFLAQARPSDAEIERALGTAGQGGLRVLLSEIVIPVTPANQAAVQARAEEIARITSFDAFSQQAREVSATNTRDRGGRMDWIALNDLPAGLRPAILELSPGEVTPPLQLPNAIALFQLRDIGEIVGQSPRYAAIEYAAYFISGGDDPARRAAGRKIADVIDTCDDLYAFAKGLPEGTLQILSLPPAEIPRDIALELAKLDPGETSLALTRNDGLTRMLLMLCGRTAELNEDASREEITRALTVQRLETLSESYLDQLRADALIVDP
ncbi:MAG: peptidylprolyl isomerase [Marinibacterium sp.]